MKIKNAVITLIIIAALATLSLFVARNLTQTVKPKLGVSSQNMAKAKEGMQQGITYGLNAGDVDPSNGLKILYYHDPMKPQVKFDKPGKSPFMNMMLKPVYESSGQSNNGVAINARIQQNFGVRTAKVTEGMLSPLVSVVGSVVFNERDQVVLQSRTSGFVNQVFTRATLDPVRIGQPLVDLYVPGWIAAQEDFLAVNAMRGADLTVIVKAARERMRQVGMNDAQIDLVEKTARIQAHTTITSPINGVVTELLVRDGMTVKAGDTLFRINGLTTVWADAEVPESQVALLKLGMNVTVNSPDVPGFSFNGKLQAILPEVNQTVRTLTARLVIDNPDERLVPGMLILMQFKDLNTKPSLLVPTEAVIQTGKRNIVIIAEANGMFSPVEVDIGIENSGQLEIKRGLMLGQSIVVSSQFLVDSEASIKGFEARLIDKPSATQEPQSEIKKP